MTVRTEIGLRLAVGFLLLVPALALAAGIMAVERAACLEAWPEDPVRWGPIDGCQVNVEGHWIQASFLESFLSPVGANEGEVE